MLRLSSRLLVTVAVSLLTVSSAFADHAGNGKAVNDPQKNDQQKVVVDMTRVAQAFLATMKGNPTNVETAVGYNRKALAGLEFDDNARTNYVYWPFLRKGLMLDYMTAEQRTLVHDMLNTALSAKGYLGTLQVMQMEKILQDTEAGGFPRGTENYTLAFFGEPALDHSWGWRFEGHHLSLNFTVAPGEVSVTPTFFGASPAKVESGVLAGFRNQRSVHEAGFALINALDDKQKTVAIAAGQPPFDIVSGNLNKPATTWDDWKKQAPQGIEVKTLSAAQKDLAQRILDEVVTVYRPEIAKSYLQQIDVNELRFVWFGGTTDKDPHYYRLEGKDFWFEYDLVQGNGNHVHAVWRSKSGDFGGDLIGVHRQQSH